MDWVQIGYTGQWQATRVAHRPIISVEISNGAYSFEGLALIDTGTDYTLANSEIAEVLNIQLDKDNPVQIAGVGRAPGYLVKDVKLHFPQLAEDMVVDVIFVEDLGFNMLLGQSDFFEKFDVSFEKRSRKFFIRPAA